MARELIKDPKATEETFKARMFELQRGKQTPTPVSLPDQAYGQGARAHLRFAPLKAFKDQSLEGGKTMKAEEAAYRAGQWLAATVYGREKAAKFCRDNGIAIGNQARVMSGNSLAAGGALIPVEMENAIIDLRDAYGVARRLARVRPMATDSLNIPRRESGLTAYFFGDDDGAGLTASDKGWGNVQLNAKKLGVLSRVSRDLIEDAVINVVDDLSMEMGYAFAVKEDQCWLDGDGTSTYGGISGIRPAFVATAYASRITATGHDVFTEVDATDLANAMGGLAAFANPGAVWLCSNTFKAVVFDRLKAAGGGNTMTLEISRRTLMQSAALIGLSACSASRQSPPERHGATVDPTAPPAADTLTRRLERSTFGDLVTGYPWAALRTEVTVPTAVQDPSLPVRK